MQKYPMRHFIIEIEEDPKRTNLLLILNHVQEPLDLPLIIERIIQAKVPTESLEIVILSALISVSRHARLVLHQYGKRQAVQVHRPAAGIQVSQYRGG